MGTPTDITGVVFDIKKFATHDGPGIRTTIFLKGCPLSCRWCHNPESISFQPELSFQPDKCIGCLHCETVCPTNTHSHDDEGHYLNRESCNSCGTCAQGCHTQALEMIGTTMSVDEVMVEVLKDRTFYETSGGGLTISGGEPMAQFLFTKALLQAAKKEGLHTCLDTSGFAPFSKFAEIMPFVDLFLFDLKESDSKKHLEYTGVPLEPIKDVLFKLDEAGAKTVLRCPLIPSLNDRKDHLIGIAETANALKHIEEITLHPCHLLGDGKHDRLGNPSGHLGIEAPQDATIKEWCDIVAAATSVSVRTA